MFVEADAEFAFAEGGDAREQEADEVHGVFSFDVAAGAEVLLQFFNRLMTKKEEEGRIMKGRTAVSTNRARSSVLASKASWRAGVGVPSPTPPEGGRGGFERVWRNPGRRRADAPLPWAILISSFQDFALRWTRGGEEV